MLVKSQFVFSVHSDDFGRAWENSEFGKFGSAQNAGMRCPHPFRQHFTPAQDEEGLRLKPSLSGWNNTGFDEGNNFILAWRTGTSTKARAFDGGSGIGKADDVSHLLALNKTMCKSTVENVARSKRIHRIDFDSDC